MSRFSDPPRRSIGILDRIAGVAAQFERADHGYLHRRDGFGPARQVTTEERDTFVRNAARSALYHLVALALGAAAAWLVVERATAGAPSMVRAGLFAVLSSTVAILLLISGDWARLAPARALRDRVAVRPARDPDLGSGPGYGTIAGVMAIAILWLLTGTIGTPAYRAFFAISAVIIGSFLIVRRARRLRHLTPDERTQAKQKRRAATANRTDASKPASVAAGCGMLLFFLLETIVGIAVLMLTLAAVMKLAGQPLDEPNGWVFAGGFILGGGLGLIAMSALDRLCKRLTGLSAMDEFSWLPVHW